MTENSPTINRRRFVQATVASTAILGGISSADAQQSGNTPQYSLEQDGKCIPITPLSMQGLPIKEFYDYRTPDTDPSSYKYASFGTQNLQREDTSILFLYKGPQGLSLVAIHDKIDAGKGGAVTFRITNLPVNGKFVVEDDSYDAQTNLDTFDYSKHRDWNGKETASANVSWTWQEGRADGMAYRGIGNDFNITINPQFNEKAVLAGESEQNGVYQGKIKKWEVLSGDVNNPTRTKLNMNKPVTISSQSCKAETTTQTTTQKTTEKTTTGGSTTSSTTTTPPSSGSKGFFGKLWSGFASLIESVVSFFTSLF
ncbi:MULTISPECIES: hypothetical protein [unclassified Haladaptatus]|uniref:hypothetical protein n=1 Tax=unclassified Haladaptatus TaxID=2622732 RepID=UPI00209BD59F|nr:MULTISPECIES: hypothetical protein [unclassified Haladaptatus]MCO8243973.1 hypothetical protein [Haladaptatus sp. AB643]MCO8256508.1 hypothetical protein [Haladaptatus sp. AB618]